ncbi:MAG: glucuronate isomerase [Calditrichaeota bacterium]|nr:glucuronate isomerase [Calditrichota bacterium]
MNHPFIHENFLLKTPTAQRLYHDYAETMPIIDYHCHINPKDIAEDRKFASLTQIWLAGDHYKWRAMRANGIDEKYITGSASDWEKFQKWAETVPYTLRNPLYHWTHMELKKPFGITDLLNPSTAKSIYDACTAMLQNDDFSCQNLIKKWDVEVICTTDDPTDSLDSHRILQQSDFGVRVFPAWRPDKAMAVENPEFYNRYLDTLAERADLDITSFPDLLDALRRRHDYFAQMGCRLSDHGIEEFYADKYTEDDIVKIFNKVRSGHTLEEGEIRKFKSAMLIELAFMDHEKGWVQQFHYGAIRNTNTRMYTRLGPDTGFDSMGDTPVAKNMAKFFDRLASQEKLTKTIIYNINPKDNEMVATMIGNFQDGSVPGKMQFGSGWWFLDQKQGIEAQLNSLSNQGLLSRFVGMLTDSRSFLSYSRHDYFRRILCNLLAEDMEKGLIPTDWELVGQMIRNISYFNAKNYFEF